MDLTNKRVVVTGAGRGIGRAVAQAFAGQGCQVVCMARSADEIAATAEAVQAAGGAASAVMCDVADPASVAQAFDAAHAEGPIDILVNNAGYASFKPFQELDLGDWRRTLDVNLTGPFLCTQAVVPGMMAQGEGRIINISSVAGVKPLPRQSAYCASKHGLNGLSKVLALELNPYGIQVHAICPGGVRTQLADNAMPDRDKADWMTPEDVAETAVFLARLSPRASIDVVVLRRAASPPLGA